MRSLQGRTPTRTRDRLAQSAVLVLAMALLISILNATRAPDVIASEAQAGAPTFPPPPRPQNQAEPPAEMNPSPLTPKQRRALLKDNYAKMKEDANQLAALAKSLQDDLNKSNENVLSLGVVEKADKIEKLAKKIKNAAVQ